MDQVGRFKLLRLEYEVLNPIAGVQVSGSAAEILNQIWEAPPVRERTKRLAGHMMRVRCPTRNIEYIGPVEQFFQTYAGGPAEAAAILPMPETEISFRAALVHIFAISTSIPRTSALFADWQLMLKLAELGADRHVEKVCRENAMLVQAGIDGHFVPLHLAAWIGSTSLLVIALEGGTNVNVVGACGMTALHWAACNGSAEVVDRLVFAGAAMEPENEWLYTPLELALMNERSEVADLLERRGAKRFVEPRITRTFQRYGVAMKG